MKKITYATLGIVALLFVLYQVAGEQVALKVMKRQLVANLSGAVFAEFPDGLNVVLCGAGSPLPDPKRSGPCVAVVAGSQVLVFDVGSGSPRNFGPMGIPAGNVTGVFLTHFHSDHIDSLGELALNHWVGSSKDSPMPLVVYGPEGVQNIVDGFNLAYQLDSSYRIAHHGSKLMPAAGAGLVARPFPVPPHDQSVEIYNTGDIRITAFGVTHAPVEPAVGYRIEYKGRSVVISGDTSKSAAVQKFAAGADLLVHEALSPELVMLMHDSAVAAGNATIAQITLDILGYHTSPVEAAQIAQSAGVKHLLFNHIVPALPLKPLEKTFMKGVHDVYKGDVTLGQDGTWIALPAGSAEISVAHRGF